MVLVEAALTSSRHIQCKICESDRREQSTCWFSLKLPTSDHYNKLATEKKKTIRHSQQIMTKRHCRHRCSTRSSTRSHRHKTGPGHLRHPTSNTFCQCPARERRLTAAQLIRRSLPARTDRARDSRFAPTGRHRGRQTRRGIRCSQVHLYC